MASKPSHRRPRRRKPKRWPIRVCIAATGIILALLTWAAIERHLAPASNTSLTRFDAIILLGIPADDDGNPTPSQLARVNEAVREYDRGAAPRLIITGGAAHNRFVEARVMARAAEAQGIPESSILVEDEARDTIQNACYSTRIMKAHGWHSAEVVGSAVQLPRAGMIFSRLPLEWRAQAAPPLSAQSAIAASYYEFVEIVKTARYLVWTRQSEQCEP